MVPVIRALIFVSYICSINALKSVGHYCGNAIIGCPTGWLCMNDQCLLEDCNRGCILQSDCPLHYRCSDGRCIISQDKPQWQETCTSTSQCKKYHMCRSGRCWKSALPDNNCTTDFSCPNNDIYTCVSGKCKIPGDRQSYGPCLSKSNCPEDHICENKKCYPFKQSGQTCTFDTDCPRSELYQVYCGNAWCTQGNVCINGQCLPEDAKRGCLYQSDCPSFYKCQDGRCKIDVKLRQQTCTSTNQCEKYHMCRLGKCWKSTLPDVNCTSDFSCPNNEIYMCNTGQCKIPGDGKAYGSCSSKTDCPVGHACEDKKCYPAEQSGSSCFYDSDCSKPNLYQCAYRRCRLKPEYMNRIRSVFE